MDYSSVIVELYNRVLENQKSRFSVDAGRIRQAIQNMKEVYMPNRNWEFDEVSKVANYNDPAHRCAYLHKYAMLHTGLMCEILQEAFKKIEIFCDINSKCKLNLCSLGGGPGTDVVGLLFILRQVFGYIQCNVTVIDHAVEWKHVFDVIVSELRTGRYGNVKEMVSGWNFSYNYLSADLLAFSPINNYNVLQAIKNADIITMIKFISAAACEKTRQMVQKIFQYMKPGAMLLFIDNAAGGFQRMIQDAACGCGMQSVFGPLNHYEYEEPLFSRKLCGYTSQSKTKVVIQMWKKPNVLPYNTTQQLQREFKYRDSRTTLREVEYRNAQSTYRTPNIRLENRTVSAERPASGGCC